MGELVTLAAGIKPKFDVFCDRLPVNTWGKYQDEKKEIYFSLVISQKCWQVGVFIYLFFTLTR